MPSFKYSTGKDFSEYKEKFLARQAVNTAVKKGSIKKPECCQMCDGDEDLQAHHIDYSQPLKVYWLCRACHSKAHGKYSLLNPINQKRVAVTKTDQVCNATIATSVSFDIFVFIKKLAEEKNTTVSALIRNAIIDHYELDHMQTDFIRDDYERKETALCSAIPSRTQSVVVDEDCMLQQEIFRLQKIRSEGSVYLPGMEELFQEVC